MENKESQEVKPDPANDAPLLSIRRLGRIARILDELMSKAVAGIALLIGKIGQKLRTGLHAGFWRNYAFFLFIALILLVVLAIATRR